MNALPHNVPDKLAPPAHSADAPAPKSGRIKWLLAIVLVASAGLVYVQWWRGPQVSVDTVQRRELVQTIVASGHVEAPHRIELGAQITGTVVRVPVAEGQQVKAGEVLVELESTELRALQLQAEVAVTQAQEKLRQMAQVQAPVAEQVVRQARATSDNALATLTRAQDLFKQGFVGTAALDDARKAAELADAQWRSSEKQLATLLPGGSDYALAQASIAQAQASAQSAKARSQYAQVRAPVAGTLIGREVEVGDVAQPGKLLMTLSPTGKAQLVVQIDEKNMRLLSVGQAALAAADAFAQSQFAAQLVYINPGVNAQTGAVEVKLDVPKPPSFLKQDMTVSVDIEVARHPQALLLPASAVHTPSNAQPWVWVVQDGHAIQRNLRTGVSSNGWVEVLDGMQEGEQIIVSTAALSANARVHTVAATH